MHWDNGGRPGTMVNPDSIPESLRAMLTKIELVPPVSARFAVELPANEVETIRATGTLSARRLDEAAAGDNLMQALGRLFAFPHTTAVVEHAAARANISCKLTPSDVATLLRSAGGDHATSGLCGLHLLRAVQRAGRPIEVAAPVGLVLPLLMLCAPEWLLPSLAACNGNFPGARPLRVTLRITVGNSAQLQAYATFTGVVGTAKAATAVRVDSEMLCNIGLCCACEADCCRMLAVYRVCKVHEACAPENIMFPVSLLHRLNRQGLATKGAAGPSNRRRMVAAIVSWVETYLAPDVLPQGTVAKMEAAATADERAQLLFRMCDEAGLLGALNAVFDALVQILAKRAGGSAHRLPPREAVEACLEAALDEGKQYDKDAVKAVVRLVFAQTENANVDAPQSAGEKAQAEICAELTAQAKAILESALQRKLQRPGNSMRCEFHGTRLPPLASMADFPGLAN